VGIRKPVIHGRDHLPGGADPIPGLTIGATGSAVYASPLVVPILLGASTSYDGFGWTNVIVDSTVRNCAVRTNSSGFHTPAINDYLTFYVTLGPQGSRWKMMAGFKSRTDGGTFQVSAASVTETSGVLSDTAPGSYVNLFTVDTYAFVDADSDQNSPGITITGAPGDVATTYSGGLLNGGPGVYSVRLKVTTKNGSSTGYRCDLTGIAFVRLNALGFSGGF
jgi:hypothetical protein